MVNAPEQSFQCTIILKPTAFLLFHTDKEETEWLLNQRILHALLTSSSSKKKKHIKFQVVKLCPGGHGSVKIKASKIKSSLHFSGS